MCPGEVIPVILQQFADDSSVLFITQWHFMVVVVVVVFAFVVALNVVKCQDNVTFLEVE